MIIKKINNKYYRIIIYNEHLDAINIYDEEEAKEFIKGIINKLNVINGVVFCDIFVDANYGIIIDIHYKEMIFTSGMDIKFTFKFDVLFLYEIDYFYKDELNYPYVIYYYNNKFYLELLSILDKKDYLKLLENSNFYLDSNRDIYKHGIKLN